MEAIGKLNAAVYRNMQSILNIKLQDTEIRSGQYDFFFVISNNPGMTQKEVTERMFVEKSTTAKAVKDLEKKGFIRKEKDRHDGRRELLYLTEKGEALKDKVRLIFAEIQEMAERGFAPEEYAQLHALLSTLLDKLIEDKKNMMQACPETGCFKK